MKTLFSASFAFSISFYLIHLVHARNASCPKNQIPCGPGILCCDSGDFCNFKRAIPACERTSNNFISGFNDPPCPDPYTYTCAPSIGEPVCCPIGTVCYKDSNNPKGACIDAYGVTASPFPSATTVTYTPVETPMSNMAGNVVFAPSDAWKQIPSMDNCTKGQTLYTTSTINATITYTYAGPSILVHTLYTEAGGTFNITIDGWATGSKINTTTPNDSSGACYPNQYPPFHSPPDSYNSNDNHTIILTYVGNYYKPAADVTGIVFDAFALPFFPRSEFASNSPRSTYLRLDWLICILISLIATFVI